MSIAVLSGKGLYRHVPDSQQVLLHDVHFDLFAGERAAISGPSGAGKSVLMRTMALLDFPDKGTLYRHNRAVVMKAMSIACYRREVAYVRQQAVLIPGTVSDNLALPYQLRLYREQHFRPEYAQEALHLIGKDDDFLQRDGAALSGGEAQIVCLLRVLQLNPQILLLDEPTSALDEDAAEAVQTLVQHWLNRCDQAAYVWISHSETQIAEVADTVWYMKDGALTHTEK